MKAVEQLAHIFAKEFEPQEAGQRLLAALCDPGGMEKFVLEHNGKLDFQPLTFGEHHGFLVYSSMTPDGRFVQEEGGVVWYDTTGKEIPCYTMALDERIGKAVMEVYNTAVDAK